MWKKEMETARCAALESGKILKKMFGNLTGISRKGEIDLVTEADLESERAVIEIISGNFPDDAILAEEGGEQGAVSDRLWIIDPLDGTTNFAHSFPYFAVSIGLRVKDEVLLGVVYNPCTDEFFEAERGKGAFLNERPIGVSSIKTLRESLIGTGFPYYIYERPDDVLDLLKKMIVQVQGIRRAGAAALDLCYLASGRMDGFWEQNLSPWDTAGASVIVKEAGGIITDFSGKPYNPWVKTILASNPYIHNQLKEVLDT